jgi:hypothetical protein
MAGLPHIGVLGPVSRQYLSREEPDEPGDIEEDEYTIPTDSEESETAYPDWKFVPNKLAYQVTLEPEGGNPLVTKVMLYVRLREGCDGDVGATLGDRPREYSLTEDELLSYFARYDVMIRTDPYLDKSSIVEITLNGQPDTTSKVSIESQEA